MGFFFFLVIIGICVAIGVGVHGRRVNEAWRDAADGLGFRFEKEGGRRIRGTRSNLDFTIRPETVGKSTWTRYELAFPAAFPIEIELRPQGLFSGVANAMLNRLDIEVGDPDFDARVIVGGSDPERIRDFLGPEERRFITKLYERFSGFELMRHRLVASRNRLETDPRRIIEDVMLLESVACYLRDSAEGELGEGVPVPEPRAPKRRPPGRRPPPLPEKEDRAVAADGAGDEAESPGAVDVAPEPDGQAVAEEPPAVEPPPAPAPEAVREEASIDDVAFAWQCQDLFGETESRYGRVRIFEDNFEGLEVEGRARLEQVQAFSMDRRLGRGPGIRRVFDLGELENGDRIRLVADSDPGADIEELRDGTGSPADYAGTLIAFDPFETTLFLRVNAGPIELASAEADARE